MYAPGGIDGRPRVSAKISSPQPASRQTDRTRDAPEARSAGDRKDDPHLAPARSSSPTGEVARHLPDFPSTSCPPPSNISVDENQSTHHSMPKKSEFFHGLLMLADIPINQD